MRQSLLGNGKKGNTTKMNNVGNAILILGAIYLHFVHGLDPVITILLCIMGLATWVYAGFTKERERLFKAKIRLLEAKAEYYEKQILKEEPK